MSERISFHVDASYSAPKYHSHREYVFYDYAAPVRQRQDDVNIELRQLKLPLGFRYTFPERKFTTFFNAGISTTFHLSATSSWSRRDEAGGKITLDTNGEALDMKNRQLGIWGGLGIMRAVGNNLKLSLELRYEHTNGVALFTVGSGDLKSEISNVQILVGLRRK